MKIASNKIKDIIRFFHNELNGLYNEREVVLFTEYCFEDLVGVRKHELSLKSNDTVSESDLLKLNFAVRDLKAFKPIQYIVGIAHFYGLRFCVNKHTLIPRPETEELVHLVIHDINSVVEKTDRELNLIDIGTGSGCIAIALKKNIPSLNVSALDISNHALEVAKKNAIQNNVSVQFTHQDILSLPSLEKLFDVIVSNPPYVRELEKEQMQANVLDYEPHLALFVADEQPFIYYKAIANFGLKHLTTGGKLYLEINEFLAEDLAEMIGGMGFKNVEVLKDVNNKNRILRCNH